MSWSATGIVCSIVVLLMWTLFICEKIEIKNWYMAVVIIVFGIFTVFIVVYHVETYEFINHVIEAKSDSAQEHINGWGLDALDAFNLLGLYGSNYFSEIGLLNMLHSGGIILVVCFYLLGCMSVYKCIRISIIIGNEQSATFYGAAGYQLAVMISTFNLPLQTVWPIGCMFYFFILLSSCGLYIRDDGEILLVNKCFAK